MNYLISSKSCRVYKKNQIVYLEGEKPQGIYCISSGKIKLTKGNKEGREQIVRILKAGDNLGYHAVLTGKNYLDSSIVIEEAKICFVPKVDFLNILVKNTSLSSDILVRLANDFNEAEELIKHMAFKSVRERMAEAFLTLKKIYDHTDSSELNITISRGDLASLVGTAKETTARLLAEFRDDKIITIEGRDICIKDWDKLNRISHLYD